MTATPSTRARSGARTPRATAALATVGALLTMVFALTIGGVASAGSGGGGATTEHKVTLCHATDSRTNPYVTITVDVDAVLHEGHGSHTGPVFSPDLPKHEKWGDIIPPFDFGGDWVYAGMNWTVEGEAIFDADCQVAGVSPSTTTPSSTSTTVESSTTTTPESTTTTPESTTTSTPASTTTTAATEHKVTLCHATDSRTNPYVRITVDVDAVIHEGHSSHTGPVFSPDLPKHEKWGDIIPPFDFGGDAVFTGLNWTVEGRAIFDNGCQLVEVSPSTTIPSTTTTMPSTTTTVPETTTTTAPSTTTTMPSTTTTVPETTTTTAPSTTTTMPSTTTTVPESTTTVPETTTTTGESTTTTSTVESTTTTTALNTSPVSTVAGPQAQVLGAEVSRTQATTATGTLPRTGSSTTVPALIALLLIAAGAAMLALRWRLTAN